MAPARRIVLADASALVAVLDARDRHHHRCAELLKTIRNAELVTTCAAFAEAMSLLGSRLGWAGQHGLWELLERGVLRVATRTDWGREAALMAQYRDTPLALADAQLMALAADLDGPPILTLDSDFSIYRLPNGAVPSVLP